jgi:hypothetical protein
MKSILLFCIAIFAFNYSFSQKQIPNNSFENWVTDTIIYPEGYHTSAYDTQSICTNSAISISDSYSGLHAIKLQTTIDNGNTSIGHFSNITPDQTAAFPSFYFQADSIHGYYKANIQGTDTAFLHFVAMQGQTEIANTTVNFSVSNNSAVWVKFSAPTNLISGLLPRSMMIEAFSSNNEYPSHVTNNSWIAFDSIYFSSTTGKTELLKNGDFESWNSTVIEQLLHSNSTIMSGILPYSTTLEKSTDATDGNYAIKLKTVQTPDGWSKRGFFSTGDIVPATIHYPNGTPFTGTPSFATYDYQFHPEGTDFTFLAFYFYKNNEFVLSGQLINAYNTQTNGYVSDTVFFSFEENPDTLVIMSICGEVAGTWFMFDNIQFHYALGVTESYSVWNVKSFPNPTTDILNFNIDAKETQPIEIIITDITGKTFKIHKQIIQVGKNQLTLQVDDLPNGTYIYTIDNKKDVVYSTFIKQ